MSTVSKILGQKRLILTLTVILILSGLFFWKTMTRQEDPRLSDFWGQVTAWFPGADANMVERLILDPLEDELAQVSQIKFTASTANDEMAVLEIELKGGTTDFKAAWDDVREALAKAHHQFPKDAGIPVLNDDLNDQEAVVLSISGSPDPLDLLNAARKIKDTLIGLTGVSKVHFIADPKEQVTIDISDTTFRQLGLTPADLAYQLGSRSRVLQGGSLNMDGKTIRLRPLTEFASLDEITATPILLPSGRAIPLSEIARVHLGPKEPLASMMRYNGEMSMGIAVVPEKSVNAITFGKTIENAITKLKPELSPLSLQYVMFQPKRTKARIDELIRSLFMGILIVAGVLIFAMGLRLGFLVAMVVPLITLISLAIFAMGGGILHQISIAAFVLALGMLVDNAIVVAENVQYRMDKGTPPKAAAKSAIKELYLPLLGATGTTIAVFIPMLIANGPTAAFTRSIPIVLILTLSISYLFAIFVTPILSHMALKPDKNKRRIFISTLGKKVGGWSIQFPKRIILGAALLVIFSIFGTILVKQQFFPLSDRNQLTIDLKLPEGSHLSATDKASRTLEKALLKKSSVLSVASFMGRSAPHFYYNIPRVPFSPHYAQLVIDTRSTDDLGSLMAWIRGFAKETLPEAEVIPRKIEQGPPVNAPIEVRLLGSDMAALTKATQQVLRILHTIEGTVDVRSNMGPGAPVISFEVDDTKAMQNGITRADIATTLSGRVRGLTVGALRTQEDPIPIKIRSAKGEKMELDDLKTMDVVNEKGERFPLSQMVHMTHSFKPAAIHHRDAKRIITVFSQLTDGTAYNEVLEPLKKMLLNEELPKGVTVRFGGEAEGTNDANASMMKSFPIGLILLFGVLLLEFNSFRRLGIILLTVPLAAAGVVPGLIIGGQPFGFMSMLGVIALIGIVVNNAIVLLERVESQRKKGKNVQEALTDAVERRIRPILLTTITTIAGLLPLAFSPSTLWPPLAWAMISGLFASTLLTLMVVPAVYSLLFSKTKRRRSLKLKPMLSRAALIILFLIPLTAKAESPVTLSLSDVMRSAQKSSLAKALESEVLSLTHLAAAEKRTAYLPTISAMGSIRKQEENLMLKSPLGDLPVDNDESTTAHIHLVQPLFRPATLFYGGPAAKKRAEAKAFQTIRDKRGLSTKAASIYLNIFANEAAILASKQYIQSLTGRLSEMKERIKTGKALETELLKIHRALDQAALDMKTYAKNKKILQDNLSRAIGQKGPFLLEDYPDLTQKPLPDKEMLLKTALKKRSDFLALKAKKASVALRKKEILAGAIPSLELSATHTFDEDSPYNTKNWSQGALTLKWVPFNSGIRSAKAAAFNAQMNATQNQIDERAREIEIEINSAQFYIEIAKQAILKEERSVRYSKETLRVETERHKVGRTTTNDLLEAAATLRESQTNLEYARLNLVQSFISLSFAAGDDSIL